MAKIMILMKQCNAGDNRRACSPSRLDCCQGDAQKQTKKQKNKNRDKKKQKNDTTPCCAGLQAVVIDNIVYLTGSIVFVEDKNKDKVPRCGLIDGNN